MLTSSSILALVSALCSVQIATSFSGARSVPRLRLHAHRGHGATPSTLFGSLDVNFDELDGKTCRVGIISTRWNPEIIGSLTEGVKSALKDCGVEDANVFETTVPGSYELPLAARFLALSGTVDAIVCVGCLIKGDTMHFEYISQAVSSGLMSVGLQTSTPVIFGVLTCNTEEQAKDRATGENNHGISWGKSAVEMALLRKQALGMDKKNTMGFGAPTPVDAGSANEDRKPFGF